MEETILKVEHVSHRYAVQWALRDVSFQLPRRGVFGLLGSNGAGKSTLMNIICGVIKQTEGEVFVHGVDMLREPIEGKRHIGFLPQHPPLYEELTVQEYLHHAADIRFIPTPSVKEAIDEVLEICSITHFRKRLLKNLSGGYQQRVGIAQAIIHKPSLVVLDEPTNGLDPSQMLEVRKLLRLVAEERAVLFSTHILSEIQETCEAVFMMNQGRLVFSGSMDEFDNYITPTTLFVSLTDAPTVDELMRIEGVTHVEDLGNMSFRIAFTDAQEVTDRLVEQSALRRWGMTEIRQERSSWDDIFAALARKDVNR